MIKGGRVFFSARQCETTQYQVGQEEILAHPPFCPDAASIDYGQFHSMAHFLCDQQFNTFGEVKEACLRFFFLSKTSGLVSGTYRDAG